MVFAAIVGQILAPDFPKQGPDLIESFFIYALIAQFTHLGWVHLALNLAGLALLVWGFSNLRSPSEWLFIQATSLFWVAFYLANIEPLKWYCGLSGALHFQFTACLCLSFFRSPKNLQTIWPLWILFAGLVTKMALELHSSHAVDTWIGGSIAYEAHRGGAIGGALMGLFMVSRLFLAKRDDST